MSKSPEYFRGDVLHPSAGFNLSGHKGCEHTALKTSRVLFLIF